LKNPVELTELCGDNKFSSQFFGDNQRIRLANSTKIQNPKNLLGTWRSITIRYIEIKDSISFKNLQVFRHDSIIGRIDNIDYIMMFKDNKFCEYKKSDRIVKHHTSVFDYQLLDGNLLHFSKSKIIGGTKFIGIDKDNIMIIQNSEVNITIEEGNFKVVNTRIAQMFFERISSQTGDF
jgi:hypothetical protein